MKVEIVTKDGREEVKEFDKVIFESIDGDVEILEGHAPMLAFIVPGEIQFFSGESRKIYQGGDGVLEGQNGKIKILIDYLKESSKK